MENFDPVHSQGLEYLQQYNIIFFNWHSQHHVNIDTSRYNNSVSQTNRQPQNIDKIPGWLTLHPINEECITASANNVF